MILLNVVLRLLQCFQSVTSIFCKLSEMSVFGNSGLKNARHPSFTSQPMGDNSKKPREDFKVVLRKKREFESVEFRYLCFKPGH
jgi:hypothetical protein